MDKETPLQQLAQETAKDILQSHAAGCLQRSGLHDAIARLARLGLESSLRLYQIQQRQQQDE